MLKVRQLVRNGARDRARTWEQPSGAPRSDPPSAGHGGQQPGPRQPRQPWDGREHILGAPVAWGASLRRALAGTHGHATFKGFQLRLEPRPPTRSHAGATTGIAAPPWSGRRHSRASEGRRAPGPHENPGPRPLLTAEDAGLRLAGDPATPWPPAPGPLFGSPHGPGTHGPHKSSASTPFAPFCPRPRGIKNIKISYEKSEEIKTQPVNNLSSREWEERTEADRAPGRGSSRQFLPEQAGSGQPWVPLILSLRTPLLTGGVSLACRQAVLATSERDPAPQNSQPHGHRAKAVGRVPGTG